MIFFLQNYKYNHGICKKKYCLVAFYENEHISSIDPDLFMLKQVSLGKIFSNQ